MTIRQKEVLKRIRDKYKLERDDFFIHNHYVIVNKLGINRIADIENMKFKIGIIHSDTSGASVSCAPYIGTKDVVGLISYASANPITTKNGYYLEMAIKRAKSKAVLEYIGAYKHGFYSEDEHID